MKIKPEHLAIMREKINALRDAHGEEKLREYRAQLANDPRVKDADMRYRWDLFNAAGLTKFACAELYRYANDTHIDTALRAIVSA